MLHNSVCYIMKKAARRQCCLSGEQQSPRRVWRLERLGESPTVPLGRIQWPPMFGCLCLMKNKWRVCVWLGEAQVSWEAAASHLPFRDLLNPTPRVSLISSVVLQSLLFMKFLQIVVVSYSQLIFGHPGCLSLCLSLLHKKIIYRHTVLCNL